VVGKRVIGRRGELRCATGAICGHKYVHMAAMRINNKEMNVEETNPVYVVGNTVGVDNTKERAR